jgi:hypothetical protein
LGLLRTRSGRSRAEGKNQEDCQRFFHMDLMDLRDELLCDREWPAKSEGARSDLQAWRRLFALILVAIHPKRNVANQF